MKFNVPYYYFKKNPNKTEELIIQWESAAVANWINCHNSKFTIDFYLLVGINDQKCVNE